MAEYRVTTLIDVVNAADGVLSLREALAAAQASAGADTILFDAALLTAGKGTIATTSTLVWDGGAGNAVEIVGDVDGDGTFDVTLDGQESHQVLHVDSGDVTMTGLEVARGAEVGEGGGIYLHAGASLVFRNGAVTDNAAGDGGGGITSEGDLTIIASTVSGNRAAYGGGINAYGTATIDGVAIVGNVADELGGAYVSGTGSTIRNTTIADNVALFWGYGGLYLEYGAEATNLTVTDNRGDGFADGVYVAGATLRNSIIVGNGSGGPDLFAGYGFGGQPTVVMNNVVGGFFDAETRSSVPAEGSGNLIGILAAEVFAAVSATGGGVVADNGGPVVTAALLGERVNPALDVGGAGASGVDARGVAAVGARDAGAYEFDGAFPLVAADVFIAPGSSQEDAFFERALPAGLFLGGAGAVTLTVDGGEGVPLPDWAAFDAATLTLSGTPPADWNGELLFRIVATDALGATVARAFAHTVAPVNDAPLLAGATSVVGAGGPVALDLAALGALDPDGDALTLVEVAGVPAAASGTVTLASGATVAYDGAGLVYTPSARMGLLAGAANGVAAESVTDAVVVRVADGSGGTATATVTFTTAGDASRSNAVRGTDGADALFGRAGDDLLRGGAGDDALVGNGGDDRLVGGAGNDVLRGHGGDDALYGGAGNDVLLGGRGNDTLGGGAGDDVLRGAEGADALRGRAGADVIRGGAGADALAGGRGRDRLIGGEGDDALHGGLGRDAFVFAGAFGTDTVADWTAGRDRINLRAADAAFADLLIAQVGGDAVVVLDAPGAEGRVVLVGVGADTLTADDFLL